MVTGLKFNTKSQHFRKRKVCCLLLVLLVVGLFGYENSICSRAASARTFHKSLNLLNNIPTHTAMEIKRMYLHTNYDTKLDEFIIFLNVKCKM